MPIINSLISAGKNPTGTKQITTNGTYDVTDFASADVQVPTTAPALYREFQLDTDGQLIQNTTTTHIMDFTGMKSVSPYALAYAYQDNTAISGAVNMGDLIILSGSNACYAMFNKCTGLTSIDLSSLTTVSNVNACFAMFSGCTGLTSINISSLTTISGSNACSNMFSGCTGLTSIDISSLTTLSGGNACQSMFGSCTGLTSIDLLSLTTVDGNTACNGMFINCTNLTSLSFPSITPNSFSTRVNQFSYMCSNIPNITLHFPSNTQTKIETLTGYSTTAPFGAMAGTVLFDLPATNTLTGADSNTYSRNPKYDTATSLAWKVGAYGTKNFTPAYYTSGLTDPTIGTTIYSDSTCTTAVTTVDSIV